MIFNESVSLDNQKEMLITETNRGVSDRIVLELESPLTNPSSSEEEEVQNINQEDNIETYVQQSYNFATGREKRVINRPKRFANVVDKNLFECIIL